jgi:hypothetical protein
VYNDLLKRIHRQFSPGAYSQAAFRVELGDSLIAHFRNDAERSVDLQLETALYWKSIMSAIWYHVVNNQAERWSRKFGPVVKVDRMTRETIRNGKEKDAYA